MINSIEEPHGRTWWDDYPQWMKDIKAWYYDGDDQTIKECTMWQYTTDLILDRTAWLIGPASMGKSTLQRVWARFQGRSENKKQYIGGKSIDPIDILSKNGGLKEVGCLCLTDF